MSSIKRKKLWKLTLSTWLAERVENLTSDNLKLEVS